MEQEKDNGAGGYTWVPDSIGGLPAKELSMVEKVLLCRIISLSKGKPCEMSNAALASRFGISTRQVTEHIKALKAKAWIDVTGPRTKRYIEPTEKALSLWKKPSIEETIYRRKHLERVPSRTIEETLYLRIQRIQRVQIYVQMGICTRVHLLKSVSLRERDRKQKKNGSQRSGRHIRKRGTRPERSRLFLESRTSRRFFRS